MSFILTCMDGFELHLYIEGEWCGYLNFESIADAEYVMDCLKLFVEV